jgi:pantothenate kinase-related protein Tda10
MTNNVIITISGPQHSGKTNLAVLFSRFLESNNVKVKMQKMIDVEDKLSKDDSELFERFSHEEVSIIIMEQETK